MVRTVNPDKLLKLHSHRDTFLRINFMAQAAHLALGQNAGNVELVRYYTSTVNSMAKKQVLRLHPNLKRTICKKCSMLLVPGCTAMVRKRAKKQPHMVVTCLQCRTVKRFVTDADYKLWLDQPHAWAVNPAGDRLTDQQQPTTATTPQQQLAATSANEPQTQAVNLSDGNGASLSDQHQPTTSDEARASTGSARGDGSDLRNTDDCDVIS